MAFEREYLLAVQESALNVPVVSPVIWPTASPTAYYNRLVDGNSFSMYGKPIFEEIIWGGGYAIAGDEISDHYEAKGQLKIKLYPQQAAFWLGAAITRIDTGHTMPWVSAEPPGDLPSFSLYHAIRQSDGSFRNRQFSGCKVAGATIEVSRGSTTAMLTLDLIASRSLPNIMDGTSAPTITAPTDLQLNYGSPYTFKQTAGGLVIATSGSTARSEYEDLSIKIQNTIDGRWFEQSYLQVVEFCGRSSTLDSTLYLKPTPDDRTNYEAIAVHAAALTFTTGVALTNLTLQFNGQNTILDLPYDLPLNQAYMTKLSLKNRYDPNAGQDLSFSLA